MPLEKFLLHDTSEDNISEKGWQKISDLTDEKILKITESSSTANAVATSVPTPLARLHAFNNACSSLKSWKEKLNDSGINQNDNDINRKLYTTSDSAKLVSELLDVLEWIYHKGNSGFDFQQKFEITVFGGLNSDDNLYHTLGETNGLKCLSSALKYACDHKAFGGNLNIQFLLHGENGQQNNLVGGTSPFTVIYTAPNFKDYGKSLNISVNKRDNKTRKLFDSTCPLEERSEDFQAYVKWLVNEVSEKQSSNGRIVEPERPIFYFQKYVDLAVTTNANSGVNARDVPICTDYILRTTNYAENGVVIDTHMSIGNFEGKKVLLLSDDSENDDLVFFNGNEWSVFKGNLILNNSFARIEDIVKTEKDSNGNDVQVVCRKVSDTFPSTHGEDYTFVTVLDLFNDKIIKSSNEIKRDDFYTINISNSLAYFIPVTPLFIRLFGKEGINLLVFSKDEKGNIKVSFTKNNIQVSKEYNKESVVDFNETFDLTIFPAKKFVINNDNVYKNYYIQVIASKDNSFDTNELKVYQATNNLNPILSENFSQKKRGIIDYNNIYHFDLNDSFEFIEINIQGNKAIIYPKWKQTNYSGSNTLHYGIDFGTSNTHAAFFLNNNNNNKIRIDEIKNIELKDLRLRFSNDESFNNITSSEFIPDSINGVSSIKFPFETILLHISDGKYDIFSQANIGFNRDVQYLEGVKYDSNLKWEGGEGVIDRGNKIKNFFKEFLLLLKLHTLESNGIVENTVFHFTFPITLGKDHIINFITPEVYDIYGNNVVIKTLSESEAPTKALHNIGDNFINIDIGGGSTDMYYRYQDNGVQSLVCGGKLAGNDLFGNSPNADKNGLLNYYFNKYLQTNNLTLDNKINPYVTKWKESILNDIDLSNLLLKKEGDFNLTKIFTEKPALKAGLLLHLTSVIHYLTKIIYDKHNRDLNGKKFKFFFTGNGSKYLKILGNENGLVGLLFRLVLVKLSDDNFNLLNSDAIQINTKCNESFQNINVGIISDELDKKEITVKGCLKNFSENELIYPLEQNQTVGNNNDNPLEVLALQVPLENRETIEKEYLFSQNVAGNVSEIRAAIKKDVNHLIDVYMSLLKLFFKSDIYDKIENLNTLNGVDSIIIALIENPNDIKKLTKPYYFEVVKRIIHQITNKLVE